MTDFDSRGYYYSKKCWYCKSFELENKGTYVQCRACGATWNEIPQVSGPIIEPGDVAYFIKGVKEKIHSRHPTAGVQRRAARARGKSR